MHQMFHIFYFQRAEILDMNSSDDDDGELPDIPGTKYPWMTDDVAGPSSADR